MIEIKSRRAVAAGLALLMLSATLFAVSTPAAADHNNDSFVDSVVEGDAPPISIETIRATAAGSADRVSHALSGLLGDDGPDAATAAEDLRAEYNNNSAAYESWAADHYGVKDGHDVIKIEQTVGGETETSYLVADIGTDSEGNKVYENSSMTATKPDGKDVDETVTLEGAAAENAADELQTLRESHVDADRELTRDDPEVIRMYTAYSDKITTTVGDL